MTTLDAWFIVASYELAKRAVQQLIPSMESYYRQEGYAR